jgi:hypothetical protein
VSILLATPIDDRMKRRHFIKVFGSAGALPLAAWAQQPRLPAERSQELPMLSVATSNDGKSVRQGHEITISWVAGNAPAGSAVALFPKKAVTGLVFPPIATSLPLRGSYIWQLPIFVMQSAPCAPDVTGGCVSSMNPGTTYAIVARLYTPANARFAEWGPANPYPQFLATAESREFTMLASP